MRQHTFDSIGTSFSITIWDAVSDTNFHEITQSLEARARAFDQTYSRFIPDSFIVSISHQTGTIEVGREMVSMLHMYKRVYDASGGLVTPMIGFALEDVGYDPAYSLKEKDVIRDVPRFDSVLSIVDDTHIMLHAKTLLDLGALGKGYLVDLLFQELKERDLHSILVNGSGDIRYDHPNRKPIRCGLEDPRDTTKVIGVLELENGSLCASGGNRRVWGGRSHFIDPNTKQSPKGIAATWVKAQTAAEADLLATALFFTAPEHLTSLGAFEYLVLSDDMKIKKSADFSADLFIRTK